MAAPHEEEAVAVRSRGRPRGSGRSGARGTGRSPAAGSHEDDGATPIDEDAAADEKEAMRNLSAFEFVIPLHQPPGEMLRLPGKFADVLAGQGSWLLRLREASDRTRC